MTLLSWANNATMHSKLSSKYLVMHPCYCARTIVLPVTTHACSFMRLHMHTHPSRLTVLCPVLVLPVALSLRYSELLFWARRKNYLFSTHISCHSSSADSNISTAQRPAHLYTIRTTLEPFPKKQNTHDCVHTS